MSDGQTVYIYSTHHHHSYIKYNLFQSFVCVRKYKQKVIMVGRYIGIYTLLLYKHIRMYGCYEYKDIMDAFQGKLINIA